MASAPRGRRSRREAGGDHDRDGDAADPRRPQPDVGRTEGLLVVAVFVVAVRAGACSSAGGSSAGASFGSLIAGILARGRGGTSGGWALAAAAHDEERAGDQPDDRNGCDDQRDRQLIWRRAARAIDCRLCRGGRRW